MIKLEHLLMIEEPKKRKLSKRADLISQIYEIYISQKQRDFRKRENWKRYINWLKENKINEKVLGRDKTSKLWKRKGKDQFKFIKELSAVQLSISMSGFKEENNNIDALYYFISMGKDMENRNQNFSGYLISHIFGKVKEFDSSNEIYRK